MNTSEKPVGFFNSSRFYRVPRAARWINTGIALVLFVISMYHFTQPNAAWRSGITELSVAVLLFTAVYFVPQTVTIVINLVMAVVVTGLGVRHVIHGGGQVSGSIELIFAVLLVVAARAVYRDKVRRRHNDVLLQEDLRN
jgi:hypothetical protein